MLSLLSCCLRKRCKNCKKRSNLFLTKFWTFSTFIAELVRRKSASLLMTKKKVEKNWCCKLRLTAWFVHLTLGLLSMQSLYGLSQNILTQKLAAVAKQSTQSANAIKPCKSQVQALLGFDLIILFKWIKNAISYLLIYSLKLVMQHFLAQYFLAKVLTVGKTRATVQSNYNKKHKLYLVCGKYINA